MLDDHATRRAEDPWRVFKIMSEFVESFDTLSRLGPAVTIFGSARTKADDPYYKAAVAIAEGLGRNKIATITGGGPGIMEAANRGAAKVKGVPSIGLNIELPMEQKGNRYAKVKGVPSIGLNIELPMEQRGNRYANLGINYHYFFTRKVSLVKYSLGFVFMPGGYGTLDELFEVVTLVQTQRIPAFPILLYGSKYWEGLLDWVKETLETSRMISPGDLDLLEVKDDPAEVVQAILDFKRVVGVPDQVPAAFR